MVSWATNFFFEKFNVHSLIMLKLQKNFNDTQNLSSLKSCTNFCFPNGKLPYPEKFTKITKVPLTDLRF